MQKFITNLRDSATELKDIRALCTTAMLIALSAVLNMVSTINIGQFIHIGLSWIPQALISVFFGPVTGCVSAVAIDVINYCVRPDGALFPGFTIGAMAGAFIYGIFLYRTKITFPKVLSAQGVLTVVTNLIINTFCLTIMYGQAFNVLFVPRLIKNAITWPIYSIMLFVVVIALEKAKVGFLVPGKLAKR